MAASEYANANRPPSSTSSTLKISSSGLSLTEACEILNVKPPTVELKPRQPGRPEARYEDIAEKEDELKKSMDVVMDRFKRLFDANEVEKGGSFYLQSKIYRARQRIERELAKEMERLESEREKEEIAGGWK